MIPKVFHRIWLGRKPMPEEFIAWGESWKRHHHGWQMKTWTEDNIPPLKNASFMDRCSCLAQQSDLVRYEILEREGGVYVDTDLECYRSIEKLVEDLDFFVAYKNEPRISNAMIGGVPGHPVFRDLVSQWKENFWAKDQSAMGPDYLSRILIKHPETKIFGERTFQAYLMKEYLIFPQKPAIIEDCPEGSYVVNHHSGQWFKPSRSPIREELQMSCPFERSQQTIMILSHPNHELPIMGLIRQLNPRIIFLTDGGGEKRVGQSRKGLKGNVENAVFLNVPENDLYKALLEKDSNFFLDLARLAIHNCGGMPDRIFCDAVEFYNPVHDISLPVAMYMARKMHAGDIPIYEIPLIYQKTAVPDSYEVQRAVKSLQPCEIRWKLPEEHRVDKMDCWTNVYTILSSTMSCVIPYPEVTSAVETVFTSKSPLREIGQDHTLRYERRGALRRELGEVSEVITRKGHYFPTIAPLLG